MRSLALTLTFVLAGAGWLNPTNPARAQGSTDLPVALSFMAGTRSGSLTPYSDPGSMLDMLTALTPTTR